MSLHIPLIVRLEFNSLKSVHFIEQFAFMTRNAKLDRESFVGEAGLRLFEGGFGEPNIN